MQRPEGGPRAGDAASPGVDDPRPTDDPVTMYLRDVGGTALLTREGEAALAKRIEAGRRLMLHGLSESPMAMQAVSGWAEAIRAGSLALRQVIDVDATHAGHAAVRTGDANSADDDAAEEKPRPSAVETAVLPRVMETLDGIAANCGRLRRLQAQQIELARKGRTLTPSQTGRQREAEARPRGIDADPAADRSRYRGTGG